MAIRNKPFGRTMVDASDQERIERLADKLAAVLDDNAQDGLVDGMAALLHCFAATAHWIIKEGVDDTDDPTGEIRKRNKEMVKRMLDYAWHDACGTKPENYELEAAEMEEYKRRMLAGKDPVTH